MKEKDTLQEKLSFDVTIRGIVPLLMARFPEEDWSEGQPRKAPKPLTKQQAYEKSLYLLDDGKTLYQPAAHIVGAMEKAASRVSLKGKMTYKEVVAGGTFILPEKIEHVIQKPTIDWRSAVNGAGKTKARIMVARGRLEEWELKFRLECWDDRAYADQLKEVLMISGAYIGIGAYRPRYGRFEVVEFTPVKQPKAKAK